MICGNCGKILDDNTIFCPACGTKVAGSVSPVSEPAAVADEPVPQQLYSGIPAQPQASAEYAAPAAKPEQKEFFGRGAFIFCLIIIALLSGTAGAFAYLYFSLLGTI